MSACKRAGYARKMVEQAPPRPAPSLTRAALWRSRLPGSASVAWRCPGPDQICLTFDDGPSLSDTDELLDVLAAGSAIATFFLLAEGAEAHPGRVRAIVDAGHRIALHGDRHESLDDLPVKSVHRRLTDARATIEGIAGTRIEEYRPPYGLVSWRALRAVGALGLRVAMWSHDPRDWDPAAPDELDARIAACLSARAVVLLHDSREGTPNQGARTAASLRRTWHLLEERGLRTITVGDL